MAARIGNLNYDLRELGLLDGFVKVERAAISDGAAVVMLAGIGEGGRIVAPPEGQFVLLHGSPEQALSRARVSSSTLIVVSLMMIGGGYLLRRKGVAQKKAALARAREG